MILGVSGEDLIGSLFNLIFFIGLVCISGFVKFLYVFFVLGINLFLLNKVFCFGIGKYNILEEIDYVGNIIVEKV